jgi:hypothetical protein
MKGKKVEEVATKELYKLDAQNVQQGWQLITLKS